MKEKNYKAVEDFLTDESFDRWVRSNQPSDALYWENWLKENPDKKVLVEEAKSVLQGSSFKFRTPANDPKLLQEEWLKLKNKTLHKQKDSATIPAKSILRTRQIRYRQLSIAASIMLVITFGALYYQYIYNGKIVHQTAFGEQLKVVLPDSTMLDLNANSSITYRKLNPRKVWLDGEAYFEVRKKPKTGANFLVVTNDLTIEVLGTAFNVAEKTDKTEVILEEGSIKLNLNREFEPELYMEPGELVSFSTKQNTEVQKRTVKSQPLTSWREGVLEFEDVPLLQVMEKIKEIYGWEAIYENKALQDRKISTPLPSNDLESTLVILQRAIGIEIEKNEKEKVLLLQ